MSDKPDKSTGHEETAPKKPDTKADRVSAKKRNIFKRFPLLTFAVIAGLVMVGGSLAFAAKVKRAGGETDGSFDTATVLPQSVTPPASAATQTFTAESIKQYDGKDGHKCYVAVNGTVYEIPQQGQWQGGQHLPSNGQAYCGADLTEAIKQSPHGTSKLQELPKVGTFKQDGQDGTDI